MSAQQILYKDREAYKKIFSDNIQSAANKIFVKNHYGVGEGNCSDNTLNLAMYKIMKIYNCEFIDYLNNKLEGDLTDTFCNNYKRKYGEECKGEEPLSKICSTSTIGKAEW